MDIDISRWILEFLLRQSVDDRTLDALVRVLPLHNSDSRLKKTMLLRRIESEISKNSVSQKILELLEHMEQLCYEEGIEVLEAMKSAYCLVAVGCAVSILGGDEGDKEVKYFDAVKRIWRGRVFQMEKSMNVGLVSENLRNWRDEIEAAVWSSSVCDNLLVKNKGNDSLEAVRAYVVQEKERLGPSFLESVAETLVADNKVSEVLRLGDNGVCDRARERLESLRSTVEEVVAGGGDKETRTGILLPTYKHVADRLPKGPISGTSRGVKIADTVEWEDGNLCNKYKLPPTPEVNKVQEALKSSSLELQMAVKDPLPDALLLAESIRADMEKVNMDHEPLVEIQNRVDVDPSLFSVDKTDEPDQDNKNLGNQSLMHENNLPKHSLMAWNSTARTYEWDEENITDVLPEGSPGCFNRPHLPSPKRRDVSPLKKYEGHKFGKRRKIKKWSILEEDTLRAGVQKYGQGKWKLILYMNRDIFEERTEVDLKDKWRNMIRC